MPRPGRAILQARAQEARAAVPCDGCGHARGDHRELPAETFSIEDGALVAAPNPAYRALDFHCGVEGCSCIVRPES